MSNGNNQTNTGCTPQGCEGDKLYFRQFEADFFDFYYSDPLQLLLNDRFPPNQCEGAKGILIMNDATIYCEFDLVSQWTFRHYAKGGLNV